MSVLGFENSDTTCQFLVSFWEGGGVDFLHLGCLKDPMKSKERAVINLKDVGPANYDKVLSAVGINSDTALPNLYRYLGKKNAKDIPENEIQARGMAKFEKYKKNGMITLERVGFSKNGEAKFYIMINKHRGSGSANVFHIGVSRKGSMRAINRPKREYDAPNPAILYALSIRKELGKNSNIARVISYENGIKVSELGCENLAYAMELTKKERFIIYISLIQGLSELHRRGFIHGDLHSENVVVQRDEAGKICGVKIIDLDTLAKSHQDNSKTNRSIAHDLCKVMRIIGDMEREVCSDNQLLDLDRIPFFLNVDTVFDDYIDLATQLSDLSATLNPAKALSIKDILLQHQNLKVLETEFFDRMQTMDSLRKKEEKILMELAAPLMTRNMQEFDKKKILNAIQEIPVEEREDVIKRALPLMNYKMNGVERASILEEIRKIPAKKREGVMRRATSCIDSRVLGFSVRNILSVIRKIPGREWDDVLKRASPFINEKMSGHEKAMILNEIRKIPDGEWDDVIKRALLLIDEEMNGHEKAMILNEIRKIPTGEAWNNAMKRASRLMNEMTVAEEKAMLLHAIRKIPETEWDAAWKQASPLMNETMIAQEKIEIFYSTWEEMFQTVTTS